MASTKIRLQHVYAPVTTTPAGPQLRRTRHGPPRRARQGERGRSPIQNTSPCSTRQSGSIHRPRTRRAYHGPQHPRHPAAIRGHRYVDPHRATLTPAPKRLFQNVEGKSQKSEKAGGSSQPLRAKTPGPNHAIKTPAPRHHLRTPGPQMRLYHDPTEPAPTPLPSAQRTRRRSRASLQSPPAHLDDADMSLDSILEADVDVEAAAPSMEDDFELEYAPPTAIDRPYVPDWADTIPDPVETMAALSRIRPMSLRLPPSPPPPFTDDAPMPTVKLCPDDELEKPILRRKPQPMSGQENQAVRGPASTASKASKVACVRATLRATTASASVRPTTATSTGTARAPSSASSAVPPKRPISASTVRAPLRTTSSATARPPTRPASTTATRTAASTPTSTTTTARSVGPATATAVRPTTLRTTSASSVRPVTSTTARPTVSRTGSASARPATASTASRRSSRVQSSSTRTAPSTKASSITAKPSVRPTNRAPVVRRNTPSPELVLPSAGSDLLDLDFGELDEPAPVAQPEVPVSTVDLSASSPAPARVVAHPVASSSVVAQPTPVEPELTTTSTEETAIDASTQPLEVTVEAPSPTAEEDAVASQPTLSRSQSQGSAIDAFDFTNLLDALPPSEAASSSPTELIEMTEIPTVAAGTETANIEARTTAPDMLLSQASTEMPALLPITGRRLARISERTEFSDSDMSLEASFDSFDDSFGA